MNFGYKVTHTTVVPAKSYVLITVDSPTKVADLMERYLDLLVKGESLTVEVVK